MFIRPHFSWLSSVLFPGLIIGAALLITIDSVGSNQTVTRIIGTQSQYIAIAVGTVAIVARAWGVRFFRGKQQKWFEKLAAGILLATTTATLLDSFTPPNWLFAHTRLNQSSLLTLASYLVFFALLNKSNSWWQQHKRSVVATFPFFLAGVVLLMRLMPFDLFFYQAKEDSLFEYIQLAILVAGCFISGIFAWMARRQAKVTLGLFLVLTIGFFFVAGEEISWGQRLLGVPTPEALREINYQEEITLHNLAFVHHKIFYAYLLLCAAGILAPWLTRAIGPLRKYSPLAPQPLLAGYFFFALLIYLGQYAGITSLPWAEVAEVFFYGGTVLWVIQVGMVLLPIPKSGLLKKLWSM